MFIRLAPHVCISIDVHSACTPSNIHIIQQPDAMVTTPANTICPPQYTIYGHGKNTHRRRIAHPHPNSQVKPNKQPAITSKCTNNASTYNHRTEKNNNHRKSINNKVTDLLAAPTNQDY